MDNDNVGFQMGRYTSSSNSHITYSGGSQPFDNRQPYMIVQYIIYIQN
jgi:microcystin-dependent protein